MGGWKASKLIRRIQQPFPLFVAESAVAAVAQYIHHHKPSNILSSCLPAQRSNDNDRHTASAVAGWSSSSSFVGLSVGGGSAACVRYTLKAPSLSPLPSPIGVLPIFPCKVKDNLLSAPSLSAWLSALYSTHSLGIQPAQKSHHPPNATDVHQAGHPRLGWEDVRSVRI